nr:reverse transcriptase domain-containing protein [Tanacetum cinerariifolium]
MMDHYSPTLLEEECLPPGQGRYHQFSVELTRLNPHFELSFADALLHIPKFALMFKSLLNNKEKLFDLATTLGGDFILDEIVAYLTSESIPPRIDDTDLDLEGDILLLEELVNNDPSLSPLHLKELNVEEIKTIKFSIDESPKLELKELLSHLEYAYLEGTDTLPVIIAKCLKDDEKEALLKVLKSHKRVVAWKITDIKVTQIDTFYNGLTLSHWDTINSAAGGTFIQKTPEECYELIKNMTSHHNHWDTSAIRDETSRNVSSTSTTKSPKVVRQLEMMNKNFSEMMRQFQTIKVVDTKYETCGVLILLSSAQPLVATLKRLLMLLREDLKAITTRSGVTLAGPSVSPHPLYKEVDREPETITDQVLIGSTNNVPPLVVQPSLASTSFSTISSSKMLEVTKDTVQPIAKNIQPTVAQTQIPFDEPVVSLNLNRPYHTRQESTNRSSVRKMIILP